MPDETAPSRTLDVRGYLCPIPALKSQEAIAGLEEGELLEVTGDDPVMVIDIPAWCDDKGHELIELKRDGKLVRCRVRRGPDP